jgi:predicted small metal-binding protein
MFTFECMDMGIDCDYIATAKTKIGVWGMAKTHALEIHSDLLKDLSVEQTEDKLESLIHGNAEELAPDDDEDVKSDVENEEDDEQEKGDDTKEEGEIEGIVDIQEVEIDVDIESKKNEKGETTRKVKKKVIEVTKKGKKAK